MRRHGVQLNWLLIISMLCAFLASASIREDLPDSDQVSVALRCADRLQQMVEAVSPAFTHVLVHFDRLIDLILEAAISMKEHLGNVYFSELPIQRAIYWMLDSLNETHSTTLYQLKRYDDSYIRLSREIRDKESMIKVDNDLLHSLKSNISLWEEKWNEFQKNKKNLDAKVQDADNRVKRAEMEIEKKKTNRNGWIVAAVFTVGLATPGLIHNENKLQKAKLKRKVYQDYANENRILLKGAEENLKKFEADKLITENSLKEKERNLTLLRSNKENLEKQFASLRALEEHIKNTTTFMSQFRFEVEELKNQQDAYMLLNPLFQLVDKLSELIGSSGSMVILLDEEKMVSKIRDKIGILRLRMQK